jgi:hypothetical protein
LAVQVLRQRYLFLHQHAERQVLAVGYVGKISEFHFVWLLLIRVQSSWHTPISLTACRLQLGATLPDQIQIVTARLHWEEKIFEILTAIKTLPVFTLHPNVHLLGAGSQGPENREYGEIPQRAQR